jgi:hypothetical protein
MGIVEGGKPCKLLWERLWEALLLSDSLKKEGKIEEVAVIGGALFFSAIDLACASVYNSVCFPGDALTCGGSLLLIPLF